MQRRSSLIQRMGAGCSTPRMAPSCLPDAFSPCRCQAGLAEPPGGVRRSSIMSATNFASSKSNLDAGSISRFASWGRGFTVERREPNTSDITYLLARHFDP